MRDPTVLIRLDGRVYRPGETLSGEYRLLAVAPEEVKAIEVSVLWHTEGKGDEDLAVHEFWRLDADNGDCIDPSRPERFRSTLPPAPLSYEGQIVKIRWCVRVRAFLARGKEILGQHHFRLGSVPPLRSQEKSRVATRNGKAGARVDQAEEVEPDSHGGLAPIPAKGKQIT